MNTTLKQLLQSHKNKQHHLIEANLDIAMFLNLDLGEGDMSIVEDLTDERWEQQTENYFETKGSHVEWHTSDVSYEDDEYVFGLGQRDTCDIYKEDVYFIVKKDKMFIGKGGLDYDK